MKFTILVTLISWNQSSHNADQHLLCATNAALDVDTLKLCASAPIAHEVRHSTEVISWSGVQGPTWQDSKDFLPSKD